jgi:Holliday junction DNA helicase RuvB
MTVTTDQLLRPNTLEGCIGLKDAKIQLQTVIKAARITGIPLKHVLLTGPAGCGKTTLALAVANEMNSVLTETTGEALGTLSDRGSVNLLYSVWEGGMLFVEECHQLNKKAQDILLPWLERGKLMTKAVIGSGRNIRYQEQFRDFTCVAATTIPAKLQDPFVQRFTTRIGVDFYTVEELLELVSRSANLLKLNIAPDGLRLIAERCKGVPRIANNILWYVQQYATSQDRLSLKEQDVLIALEQLGIAELGLTKQDIWYLRRLSLSSKPVGLATLSASLSETTGTVQGIEGYLMRQFLVEVTGRGRALTEKGIQYLKGVR